MKLKAFTILEITIVLALTSLLTTLFFGALNRFNKTIAIESKIKTELNNWFSFRSNLWRELDVSDSIKVEKNQVQIYSLNESVLYKIDDSKLIRIKNDVIKQTELLMNSIEKEQVNSIERIVFHFDWKGEDMKLSYPLKQNASSIINDYFLNKRWQ